MYYRKNIPRWNVRLTGLYRAYYILSKEVIGLLANIVRQRRKELGLTQDALATKAGTTRQTVIAIERGRTPTVPVMLRLAEALAVRPDVLFFTPNSNTDLTGEGRSRLSIRA